MKYLIYAGLVFFLPGKTAGQTYSLQVDLQRKEYFVTNPHFFSMYDSTGKQKVHYSNDKNNPSDTLELYFFYRDINPAFPRQVTFQHFTRDNHLVSIPRLDPAELVYRIDLIDSLWVKQLPCSNADVPVDVMRYDYTARIFYNKLILFKPS